MSANDGGPAFPMASGPEPRDKSFTHYNEGMSLRDYFAGQAMTGMLASDAHPDVSLATLMDCHEKRLQRAEFAYTLADAMLAARSAPVAAGGGR